MKCLSDFVKFRRDSGMLLAGGEATRRSGAETQRRKQKAEMT